MSFSYMEILEVKKLDFSKLQLCRYLCPNSLIRESVVGQSKNRWAMVSLGGGSILFKTQKVHPALISGL
jgi:hypothetical protein